MEWACTVKRKYFDAIKDGRKKYEVRKRVPYLNEGDLLFICCGDKVVVCVVVFLLKVDKVKAWHLYKYEMCIDWPEYMDYLEGIDGVNLIRLRVMGSVVGEELKRFRSAVVRNPQWFSKVKY